jgi:arabinofuranosyltransferase
MQSTAGQVVKKLCHQLRLSLFAPLPEGSKYDAVIRRPGFERHAVLELFAPIFIVAIICTAWVGDDAFISLRTVHNFVNGLGLTWNAGERVQAFTDPLWVFMLSGLYALTHEAYFTTIALGFAVSLATLLLVGRNFTTSIFSGVFGLSILCLSSSFVVYSTSGLENPLTCLLLALFLISFFRLQDKPTNRQVFVLGLLAALSMTNRVDTGLFYLPALLLLIIRRRNIKTFVLIAASMLPILLWEAFSFLYYGFLGPNTAYAKLNTGISELPMLLQGLKYYLVSGAWDPLSGLTILAGTALGFKRGEWRERAVSAGLVLYLLYVVYIGGDFMSGRFFAGPLLVSVVLLMRLAPSPKKIQKASVVVGIVLLGLLAHPPTVTPDLWNIAGWDRFKTTNRPFGVANEHGAYFAATGLINVDPSALMIPDHHWSRQGLALRQSGNAVALKPNIGFFGYFAGSDVYIIDSCALADPLLARLPVADLNNWRVGHYFRDIPEGYVETLKSGTNMIADPNLAMYYDKLKEIVSGNVFSLHRLRTIVDMNLGRYDYLVEEYVQATKADGALP